MRVKIIILFNLLFFNTTYAQTTYVDVLTAPAMGLYALNLEEAQNNTIKKMTLIEEKQVVVGGLMIMANDVQNKVLKGLKEVSGAVSNGIQLKRIAELLVKIPNNLNEVYREVGDRPEFAVFGVKAGKLVFEKSVEAVGEIADITRGGEFDLMSSGDRINLLASVELKLGLINNYLINIKYSIQRAKSRGFWQSLNPFQSYMNTDKEMFDQIIRQSDLF